MKKFAVSIAAICAMMFFVACGGNSTGNTDTGDSTTDTGDSTTDTGDSATDTGDSTTDTGDSTTDTGDSTTDTGDSTTDTGDSTTDTGDSTTDTGDSTTDTGDSTTDTGDSEPDDDTEPADTGDSEPQGCELSDLEKEFVGTWAQKIILRSKSSTTLAKNVPSVTTRYLVTEIKADANCKLDFFKKGNRICRTDNRTGDSNANKGVVGFNEPNSKFNTIFKHWKPADLPGHEGEPYLEVAENGGEKTFKLNRDWELRGADMTDPSTEEMISDKGDGRIFDHDEDGKSAFTITFNGFVSGPIYYVQRLNHILTGKVVAEGKIEGNVKWDDEQYTHPDTPNLTLKGQKTTVTDETKSVFQLVKVDDSMDCETLLEKADNGEIFDLADPNEADHIGE